MIRRAARLGTPMGEFDADLSPTHAGRREARLLAVTVQKLDEAPNAALPRRIESIPNIFSARLGRLQIAPARGPAPTVTTARQRRGLRCDVDRGNAGLQHTC